MTMPPPPRLLGRTGELEILGQLIANVRSGQSAVLVVRGEPGIGKTALLRHLIAHASGFHVVRAAGVESEMELAFAGLHQLCAPMLGRLDSLADPQRRGLSVAFGLASGNNPDRFMVALAALSLMAETSEDRPLLCVVDDAQWLDQASAQVLGFVGRRLLAESIALVFAARTPPRGPQGVTSPASPDHLAGLPELGLGGLDEEPARALLATVTSGPLDESVRARIIEETHGNPLALLELCRGLGAAELAGGFALPDAGDLPRRIEDQYLERLGELPDEAQRLVLLAAADPVGDAALVLRAAQILGLDSRAFDFTGAAGLVDIGMNVRFRHPLVRSAAYRVAAVEDRRAAHARVAAHLARARLSYGEWLRRENRRIEARNQLRPAFEALTSIGAHAFAERARRELLATGEKVRKRNEDTRGELTPQEEEIAQLARDGRTNPEIGAQLFIGARTVEWHLGKVFAKLDITSRRELDEALSRRVPSGATWRLALRERMVRSWMRCAPAVCTNRPRSPMAGACWWTGSGLAACPGNGPTWTSGSRPWRHRTNCAAGTAISRSGSPSSSAGTRPS